MAQTCEFQDVDFEIEEQIIIGGSSSRIRKRALRDPTYNLAAMLLDGRRDESPGGGTRDIFGRGCGTIKSLYRPFLEFLTKKLDPFRDFCA